jgi:hypothetical protein
VEDADGVAHVAITAGSLVEAGAPPRPLGESMVACLPPLLAAARRFADACLAELEDPGDVEGQAIAEVDGMAIPRGLFRAQLDRDRAGGAALAHLDLWTLPAIAAWTRDRELLARVVRDEGLVSLAASLRRSDAYFLDCLLGVELDAEWLVVLPLLGRAFDVRVDGIVRNWDAHALLADALHARGVAVTRNAIEVLDALRAHASVPSHSSVRGTWNLYSFRAAAYDLARGAEVPTDVWVWGEGGARDIPRFRGRRTLLLGPASIERGWNAGRVFSELLAEVTVMRESEGPAVAQMLREMRGPVPT